MDGAPVREALSDREAQVLGMVALGHTTQHIAEQLFLSIRTVETYQGAWYGQAGPARPR